MTPLQKATAQAIVNVFETGRPQGDYARIGLIDGDAGGLSYGRAQVSLGSGNLARLLNEYCGEPDALHAGALRPYLPRLSARDATLNHDDGFRASLAAAGADPCMRRIQDAYFDREFWQLALRRAEAHEITTPLGIAVVYDSCIQGGFASVALDVDMHKGRPPAVREECWIEFYVKSRRSFLAHSRPPLPSTTYRLDAFMQLIEAGNWNLDLPITAHGVTISADALEINS